MDRTERFYKIDQLLHERRATPLALLVEDLGVSRATIKRDLEYLRDRLNAPIVWDPGLRGYRYEQSDDERYSLPGLWLNSSEIHALLSMEHLLSNLQPGLLGPHIEPLRSRIRMLLDVGDHSREELTQRIRVLNMAARPVESAHFETIATGLLKRRRLQLEHYHRQLDKITEREVSPQRLVYYRGNWYLDAWCHLRKGLRSFGVDALRAVKLQSAEARDEDEAKLEAELGAGYGIFAGWKVERAVLRVHASRARWVSQEKWHSAQQGHFDEDGQYILTVPYSDDRELIMDILRYGPDIEVLSPANLREKVLDSLRSAQQVYSD
ncbi:MAG: YafY family protein [Gammaproteobacteria bacterium]|nr:YafY family protein [Gammaproteobacteria bacterium]MCY4359024.1 YafY family protein [Gammaproteobacteria bacterium]